MIMRRLVRCSRLGAYCSSRGERWRRSTRTSTTWFAPRSRRRWRCTRPTSVAPGACTHVVIGMSCVVLIAFECTCIVRIPRAS